MARTTWPTGISPSGRGIRIRIWSGGRLQHSETIQGDPHSPSDVATAVRRREYLLARQKLGLALTERDDRGEQTFDLMAQSYIEAQAAVGIKRSTLTDYVTILNGFWVPVFGNWKPSDITSRDILRVVGSWNVSGKTKKNRLGPLSGVLGHAGINPNPAAAVKIRRGQKPAVERYSPQERDKLLALLDGQALVYFALLFGCGLRPGEALGLTWSDFDGELLTITRQIARRRLVTYTKTSRRRTVYVPSWVRPIILGHTTRFQGGHIVVNSKGGPFLDTDVVNAAWRQAHRKARLPYRIPYTCRHTRASELLSTGVEPGEAAKQMGHSLQVFLTVYAEWIEEYSGKQDLSRFEGRAPTKMQNLSVKEAGKIGKLQ